MVFIVFLTQVFPPSPYNARISELKEPLWAKPRLVPASHRGVFSDSEEGTQVQDAALPPSPGLLGAGERYLIQTRKNGVMGEQPSDCSLPSALITFMDKPSSSLQMSHLSQKVHQRERAGGKLHPRCRRIKLN